MPTDPHFARVAADPEADEPALVYADWLDERGDPDRAGVLRLRVALRALWPDHPHWHRAEILASQLRRRVDPAWLEEVAPALCRSQGCGCTSQNLQRDHLRVGRGLQDTECDAWRKLEDVLAEAAARGAGTLAPLRDLTASERAAIVTLPPTVGQLAALRSLDLYGSNLERLPPEIGALRQMTRFNAYTSYRLHAWPYEITGCAALADTQTSTRAMFGNFKTRLWLPDLARDAGTPLGTPEVHRMWGPPRRACAVCRTPYDDEGAHRAWHLRRVGTDRVALLVNACSAACLASVGEVHRGGAGFPGVPPRRPR